MVKDQDYLKKTASFCIDLAKKLGATDSTAAVMHSISETVNFRNKKLDESDRSDSLGVSLTTYIGKKKSSISSSNLTEENISSFILSFKNDVPLAIDEADIALAKTLNIPFEILLSKMILILSLSIFRGFSFCIVFFAAIVPI